MSSDEQEEASGVTFRTRLVAPAARIPGPLKFANYAGLTKFRIIDPNRTTGNKSTISTSRKPLQRIQAEQVEQQQGKEIAADVDDGEGQCNDENSGITSPMARATLSRPSISSAISRLPSKLSGLARPTPVRQMLSSAASSQQGSLLDLEAGNHHQPRLTFLSAKTPALVQASVSTPSNLATTTGLPSKTSRTVTKTTASERLVQPSSPATTPFMTANEFQNRNKLSSGLIDLSSVEDDVSQIRKLLEQLVPILVDSQQTQERLASENEQLRNELASVKSTLKALKKAYSLMS